MDPLDPSDRSALEAFVARMEAISADLQAQTREALTRRAEEVLDETARPVLHNLRAEHAFDRKPF